MSYMHQHINKIFNMYVDALNMVQHFFFPCITGTDKWYRSQCQI